MDLLINNMKKLKLNHTYLIKYGCQKALYSITILLITNKAYYIRWNNENGSSSTWEDIDELHHNYNVFEDITEFSQNIEKIDIEKLHKNYCYNYLQVKTELQPCENCGGIGTVPDYESTAMIKTCPVCNGSKQIPRITQIEQK